MSADTPAPTPTATSITAPRVTGTGGVFFKAKDAPTLRD